MGDDISKKYQIKISSQRARWARDIALLTRLDFSLTDIGVRGTGDSGDSRWLGDILMMSSVSAILRLWNVSRQLINKRPSISPLIRYYALTGVALIPVPALNSTTYLLAISLFTMFCSILAARLYVY